MTRPRRSLLGPLALDVLVACQIGAGLAAAARQP
jgi:hypothetical protein